jgi:hypothetical protein
MKIEVLHILNCPNQVIAVERLREILASESFQADISEILVTDETTAQSLKFPGSPTIRINGRDIEPPDEKTASFGLMCRLYADGNGAPSHQRLRHAIRRGRGLEV